VRFVRLDPPGTWCQNRALFERLASFEGRRFLEVGCGDGSISRVLCSRGYSGVGVDFSPTSLEAARRNLEPFVGASRYEVVASDFWDYAPPKPAFDLVFSMLVVEHIADDEAFVRKMAACVRPGGLVLVAVPGRRDCWGLEDETVGHLRRYDRSDLENLLVAAGLVDVGIWSVAVPTANVLRRLGNFLIARSRERAKLGRDSLEQTKESGVRDIPFKTTFPPIFRLVLNRWTMWPFGVLQRLFYRTELGVTLLGWGQSVGAER